MNSGALALAQSIDGVETSFTWDQALAIPQVLATSDGTKSLYGLERLAVLQGGAWHYPQHDALGSVRQWTDATAAVLAMQSYSPFGVARTPLGPVSWGFTGEWHDPGGLVYLRARWYSAAWGRFTQVDPFPEMLTTPATRHPYAYAHNNPLRFIDPTGHQPAQWWQRVRDWLAQKVDEIRNALLEWRISHDPCAHIVSTTCGRIFPTPPGVPRVSEIADRVAGGAGHHLIFDPGMMAQIASIADLAQLLLELKGLGVGIDEFRSARGHHIHSQKAYEGVEGYDKDAALSISPEYMEQRGWIHELMTAEQRRLYRGLYQSGRPHTLEEDTRIAVEALIAGNVPREEAEIYARASQMKLEAMGVQAPGSIPWYRPD